jgi:uncharacterized protein with HEPN domain
MQEENILKNILNETEYLINFSKENRQNSCTNETLNRAVILSVQLIYEYFKKLPVSVKEKYKIIFKELISILGDKLLRNLSDHDAVVSIVKDNIQDLRERLKSIIENEYLSKSL